MSEGIKPKVLAQMEKVAETGSTIRKYRVQAYMPVDACLNGYIEIDAINEEEALKVAQDKLDDDTDNFTWDNDAEILDYNPRDTQLSYAEEVNCLKKIGK